MKAMSRIRTLSPPSAFEGHTAALKYAIRFLREEEPPVPPGPPPPPPPPPLPPGPDSWLQVGATIEGGLGAGDAGERLGNVLAISEDGTVIATGSPQTQVSGGAGRGYVKVYALQGGAWVQRGATYGNLEAATNEGAGRGVALSGDGTTVAVSFSSLPQRVQVRRWTGSEWVDRGAAIQSPFPEADTGFGINMALSSDGEVLVVGAAFAQFNQRGQVYRYRWDEGTTSFVLELEATLTGANNFDRLGTSLALSTDGSVLVVSSVPFNGVSNVQAYTWDAGSATLVPRGDGIIAAESGSRFGTSVRLSADGSSMVVTDKEPSPSTNVVVRSYDWTGTVWVERGSFTDSRLVSFGATSNVALTQLSLSGDGLLAAVSMTLADLSQRGYCQVYGWTGDEWIPRGQSFEGAADSDGLGAVLSRDGSTLAVSIQGLDVGPVTDAGAVQAFRGE
jgi:hypothetical protein